MNQYLNIQVRLSQDQEHFLLNPFGLQYHEITASSLLKVDMQGNIVDPGSTSFSFNKLVNWFQFDFIILFSSFFPTDYLQVATVTCLFPS